MIFNRFMFVTTSLFSLIYGGAFAMEKEDTQKGTSAKLTTSSSSSLTSDPNSSFATNTGSSGPSTTFLLTASSAPLDFSESRSSVSSLSSSSYSATATSSSSSPSFTSSAFNQQEELAAFEKIMADSKSRFAEMKKTAQSLFATAEQGGVSQEPEILSRRNNIEYYLLSYEKVVDREGKSAKKTILSGKPVSLETYQRVLQEAAGIESKIMKWRSAFKRELYRELERQVEKLLTSSASNSSLSSSLSFSSTSTSSSSSNSSSKSS